MLSVEIIHPVGIASCFDVILFALLDLPQLSARLLAFVTHFVLFSCLSSIWGW